ncbi:MAG: hypothetical protein GY856_00360 [bacterium]|nr:hypothetical protein [bacterium]
MDERSIEEHNLVERYVTGRLSADEAGRFEEYFLGHPECAVEVRLAQRLHRGLEAVAAQEVVGRSLALGLWSRFLRSRAAMLAALLVVAVAIVPLTFRTWRVDQLEESLEAARKPQVNTPIFELSSFRSADLGTPAPHLLTLSPDPEWIVLALAVPGPERPSYCVELRDADERLVWEASDLRPDPLGRLVMTLPSTLLPAGDFEIRALGSTGDTESVPVGHFALRVAVGF